MPQQTLEQLHRLCEAAGAAGHAEITQVSMELLRPLVDEVDIDAMGNVLAMRRCADENAPTVLLQAHLDEIGFLVTHIDDKGFVHVDAAGSVDERVLTAQPVVVYGHRQYNGVFSSTPPHLASKGGKDNALTPLSARGIDLGMEKEAVEAGVPLGSRVSFAPNFKRITSQLVSSKVLDNRAGMAAILHALRQIKDKPLTCHVAVAFCVQEELGCRGSAPAVRRLSPDCALVTDVSFAYTPDAVRSQCGCLGEGVMIGISPILNRSMEQCLFALAEKNQIPHQTEVMAGSTGTDADTISKEGQGIPTALLSIPLRYMHTPTEVVDVRDVIAVGDLMAAYIQAGGVAK